MRIKIYHCHSVESAVRQARRELGEDAMLLESRKAKPEDRHRGAYEVRFAVPGAAPAAEGGVAGEGARRREEIRRSLGGTSQTLYASAGKFASQPELAGIYRDLVAQGVEPELAAQLSAGLVAAAERSAPREELERDLRRELEALLAVAPEPGVPEAHVAVMAVVGPSGVGKTSTLAKLAFRFGLEERRAVELLSIDHSRVGAYDQLLTYASLLGLSCQALEDVDELRAALASADRRAELVLIDTPGLGFHERNGEADRLARFLSGSPEIDVHLVLSATTKSRDQRCMIERYGVFGPRKLLFTKLDETFSYGPLLNEAVRTQWPLSFLGLGRRIPEDLAPAGKAAVADWLLGGRPPNDARRAL